MAQRSFGPGKPEGKRSNDTERLERLVAESRGAQAEREKCSRQQSLRMHPWICARCGREFTRENLHLLTVHHKDHDHENNPRDGSNWENLCLYCHDNEHSRYLDHAAAAGTEAGDENKETVTHRPFAKLGDLLSKAKKA